MLHRVGTIALDPSSAIAKGWVQDPAIKCPPSEELFGAERQRLQYGDLEMRPRC